MKFLYSYYQKLFPKVKSNFKKIQSILVIVLTTSAILSTIFFILGSGTIFKKTVQGVDYKVHLSDNDFFGEQYLPSDMIYVSGLIKDIDIIFNYPLDIYRNSNNYTYSVTAKTLVTEKTNTGSSSNDRVIFNDSTYLIEPKSLNASPNNHEISEIININYADYNKRIMTLKSTYSLPDLSASVTISLNITPENNLQNATSVDLCIPLADKLIAPTITSELTNDSGKSKIIDMVFLSLAGFLLVVSVLSAYLLYKLRQLMQPATTNYMRKRNKILRNSEYNIVRSVFAPSTPKCNIYHVKTFEDILNVSDTLHKPIIFYEISKDSSALFTVIDDSSVYKYLLTDEENDTDEPDNTTDKNSNI